MVFKMRLRRLFRNIGNIKLTGYFIGFLFLSVFIICILSVDELEKTLKGRLINEGLEINSKLMPTISRYLDSKNVVQVRKLLEEQGFNLSEINKAKMFASGGIASLTTTIPPKRGPNHQGLASLKKYGKQY